MGNYPQLLGTAWHKVKPAELQAVSGWYRGAKPGFSWGQICRVVLAPELPVELAGGFQSNYVESWFSFCPALPFSHPCRCIPEGLSPICLSPSESVLRKATHSLTYTSKNCAFTERRKKNHSILGGNHIVNLFHYLWLYFLVSFFWGGGICGII